MIMVPVSAGELVDKITILKLKQERLRNAGQLANVNRELALLQEVERSQLASVADYSALYRALLDLNAELWDIEEGKRDCERRQVFDGSFIELARQVCLLNDRRASIKRELNVLLRSPLMEEKSYGSC
jgi:hypothetical protein